MRVSELMVTPPVTVPPQATARLAAIRMTEEAVGCVLVAEDDRLLGIVTDRDLVVRGLAGAAEPDTTVAELMSATMVTIEATADLETAYRALRRTGVRRLPVLDGHRLVGLLTVDDLLLDVLYRLFDLLGPVSWSALREGGPRDHERNPIGGACHDTPMEHRR
ncbi:CBS domain-containing protein [Kitasatospora sp. NBC_01287]|uniref:CBS domain-containing protein n=1 Tax=Kitasatospora sp. NBC_01287 TaxID=2903573 RepID=UPI002256F7B6|nr:CBS domain-containing protein [Kitasatospora sp. NBC_01287]MCX4744740.1 CBS domain-containing protein [Kitasatospora sp. NBC_01287]